MHKDMAMKQKPSRSSQHFRAKANNRVDDLQCMVSDLQQARREGRLKDVSMLEEQMHQMLREWKAELREASPTSSLLQVASPCNSELSSDMERLLQLHDEDDDATSKAAPMPEMDDQQPYNHDHPNNSSSHHHQETTVLEAFARIEQSLQEDIQSTSQVAASSGGHDGIVQPSTMPQHNPVVHTMSDHFSMSAMVSPLAAYLHPKCALWDCPRPCRGGNEGTFYCSSFHEELAITEGAPGMCPVVRPGGIDLKDGPLFAALAARVGGHAVGIPELQGAATSKSPWNATDLFDVAVHPGETLREWLFFDKPRRAFESGTRKQRSLPDYGGRGWHESRKQIMKDLGGLKRSYYMDPQPEGLNEWHMYEYEVIACTDCALYRLELKVVDASKRSGKVKAQAQTDSSVASLQHQIGRLSADLSQFESQNHVLGNVGDGRDSNRGRGRASQKRGLIKSPGPGPLVSALSGSSSREHTPFNYTAELP
ncbi:transcription factor VOZ1 isoform X2 [Physcomitrium patens]|uniref:Transcription factor VOZ1 n=1 Tax=Physcomitrium patens TaxID=3218 RepID=A0A2K1KF99_PHYPA|nr:transcription factor VOZ1-like isoform X2 [Physcomitrium patens]PNR52429.1 hypothetical protein PHYPA_008803 [Physcomitrium patens]|eukprot:XP_024378751.1 transcription factor VOZ1-like isoform X2 [Physcomitrella patens]